MSEDFNVITEKDKRDVSYGVCVLGHMAFGATIGSMAGGQTLFGAAGGVAWGLFTCKHLAEPIKRKLFSRNVRLSEPEFRQALVAVKRQFPHLTKTQALQALLSARLEATTKPERFC